MKAEYINPFIEASRSVFKNAANIELDLGKIYLKTDPYDTIAMMIMIGVTGALRGRVIISMDEPVALATVSNMMGMEVTELDEIGQSALMEVCNMMLGTTATILANNELIVDITPPTLLMGTNMKIFSNQEQTVCVPLIRAEGGTMEINITLA